MKVMVEMGAGEGRGDAMMFFYYFLDSQARWRGALRIFIRLYRHPPSFVCTDIRWQKRSEEQH